MICDSVAGGEAGKGGGGGRGMTCESCVIEACLGFEDCCVVYGDDSAVQEEGRGKKCGTLGPFYSLSNLIKLIALPRH